MIEIRGERNPLFPGMKGPEPLAETLGPLMRAVKAHGADLGIAFDGDGDRIALVDSRGEFVSSQDTFAMLAMYLGERDDVKTGAIVRSVNGSVMLDLLAERYDVPLIETPIGYAHIAPAMIEHRGDARRRGERRLRLRHAPAGAGRLRRRPLSSSISCSGAARTSRACATASKFAPARGTTGGRMSRSRRTRWTRCAPASPLSRPSDIDLAGSPVTKTVTLDGVKLIGEDRRWLLVRTSGTEPLARIYAEARDPETVESLLALGQSLLRPASEEPASAPASASPIGRDACNGIATATRARRRPVALVRTRVSASG